MTLSIGIIVQAFDVAANYWNHKQQRKEYKIKFTQNPLFL